MLYHIEAVQLNYATFYLFMFLFTCANMQFRYKFIKSAKFHYQVASSMIMLHAWHITSLSRSFIYSTISLYKLLRPIFTLLDNPILTVTCCIVVYIILNRISRKVVKYDFEGITRVCISDKYFFRPNPVGKIFINYTIRHQNFNIGNKIRCRF